jgi:tetratricopeptide (TPR) repeat protein
MLPSRFSFTVAPQRAVGWFDGVRAALAAGRFGEAIETMQKAAAAEPDDASIQNELGHAQLLAGQFEAAAGSLRRAVALDPGSETAHLRLGVALSKLGDDASAAKAFEQATTLEALQAETHYQRGLEHEDQGRPQPALASFRRAAATATHVDLLEMAEARALSLEGREEDAAPLLRAVLRRQPTNIRALALLGDILAGLGLFEEAERCFENSLALRPAAVETFYNIVRCRRITTDDAGLIERMDAALHMSGLSDLQRSSLQLARGKALEDLGRYGKAMAAFDDASEARARAAPFDLREFVRLVDSLITRFDAAALSRTYDGSSADPTPTFVLGMPRSGTTVCEHVLCSHPDVASRGELHFWTTFGPALAATGQRRLEGSFGEEAARYLEYLRGFVGPAARVIDKTPWNFLWIGLIHIIFPRATMIHCRRRPIDTAISIHQTAFAPGLDLPTGGSDLVGYFRQYQRLMAHWRAVLPPGRMLEVDYETLTASPEREIRRIIAHAGLEWNDACLRPQDSRRMVRTPSRWQVRQPINPSSVDRWRRYEPHLGALAALRDTPSLD